jgi:hypothetical protein
MYTRLRKTRHIMANGAPLAIMKKVDAFEPSALEHRAARTRH